MLKRFLAVFLLFAVLSSGFSRFFEYAGFELNKTYLTAQFCINKSKPWLHCNGHCYLMKKVKQAEEKEKKQARNDQKNHYLETLPDAAFILTFLAFSFKTFYPECLTPGTVQQDFTFFQPPRV